MSSYTPILVFPTPFLTLIVGVLPILCCKYHNNSYIKITLCCIQLYCWLSWSFGSSIRLLPWLSPHVFRCLVTSISGSQKHLSCLLVYKPCMVLAQNLACLAESWDVSFPIEILWVCITENCHIATNTTQPISDAVVIVLVLPMFKCTGLFIHIVNTSSSLDLITHLHVSMKAHYCPC